MVDKWDTHFDSFADQNIEHLLDAVKNGDSYQSIEKLFSQAFIDKRNYRAVSVTVPENANENDLVKTATEYLSTPYHYGGDSKSGVDCSGLMCLVFETEGIDLPRKAELQFLVGTYIPTINKLRIGDLVFFATEFGQKATHVGLYVGEKKMIHASSCFGQVLCVSLDRSYYKNRFLGGRRIINRIREYN
ncbi:C40 family peptidase [candidate division KSB1 bacterium]|nr:C40 family peptidase [candidate division KSB1 bacterium]